MPIPNQYIVCLAGLDADPHDSLTSCAPIACLTDFLQLVQRRARIDVYFMQETALMRVEGDVCDAGGGRPLPPQRTAIRRIRLAVLQRRDGVVGRRLARNGRTKVDCVREVVVGVRSGQIGRVGEYAVEIRTRKPACSAACIAVKIHVLKRGAVHERART